MATAPIAEASRSRPEASRPGLQNLGPEIAKVRPSVFRSPPAPPRPPARPEPAAQDPQAIGRELFARRWQPNDPRSHGGDGLGPVYNASSCLACHHQGGPGGSGPNDVSSTFIANGAGEGSLLSDDFKRPIIHFNGLEVPRPVNGLREWSALLPDLRKATSVVLHRFGVDASYAERRKTLLELANDPMWEETLQLPRFPRAILVQLNTPALFGAGLIDVLPDRDLLASVTRLRHPEFVRGRLRRLRDGRIGRFGWKAQEATLNGFVLGACANEVGLEVPGRHQAAPLFGRTGELKGLDLTRDECDALTSYIRHLPAPISRPADAALRVDDIEQGRRLFESIGCADCHTPDLGEIRGIYSDLRLHQMSRFLSSAGGYYGGSSNGTKDDPDAPRESEWRTPPLWGVASSAPYLHDGRAQTLEEAIAAHEGGEPTRAMREFFVLPAERRAQVLGFLNSLVVPPADPRDQVEPPAPGPSLAEDPSLEQWRHELERTSRKRAERTEHSAPHDFADELHRLAEKAEKNGRLDIALRYYRKILSIQPGSVEGQRALERIAILQGN